MKLFNLIKHLTFAKGNPDISTTREISTPSIREICPPSNKKLITDSLTCPYCASKNFVKRGWRQKKLERVQLLFCQDCGKTFTPQITKGLHFEIPQINIHQMDIL